MKFKTIPSSFAIYTETGNPVYDCVKVSLDDESAGTFIKITDETDGGDGETVKLMFEEWDAIVEVVAANRKQWESKI